MLGNYVLGIVAGEVGDGGEFYSCSRHEAQGDGTVAGVDGEERVTFRHFGRHVDAVGDDALDVIGAGGFVGEEFLAHGF